MAAHPHLFRRRANWYWRRTFRAVSLPKKANFICSEGEIALSLKTADFASAVAVSRLLSTVFDGWMERFRMLKALETIDPEQLRCLLGWALQDIRDAYMARIGLPEAIPDWIREQHLQRLRAEAVVIQSAIRSADYTAIEGFAGEALRRRGVHYDPLSPSFRGFVREVAPGLLEARLNEIIRMDPQGGLSWNRNGIVEIPPATDATQPIAAQRPIDPRLSGRTIGDCAAALMVEFGHSGRLGQKTADQYRQTFGLLIKFLGDRAFAEVSRADGARFKEFIQKLPAKYGQAARYAGLPLAEIIATADRIGDKNRIQPPTWNRHAVALAALGSFAKRHGDASENVFNELAIPKLRDRKETVRDERDRFGTEALTKIFSSPVFTGMRSKQFNYQPGEIVHFESWYWLPLISVTTGMRCEEIAQLQLEDIKDLNSVLCFKIWRGPNRELKSDASKRNVPVPEILFRLGFREFADDRRQRKNASITDLLIPGCHPTGKYERKGTVTAKWFGRYLINLGLKGNKDSFHSLRHDFASAAHIARLDPTIFDYIFGHSTGRLAFDRYSSGIEPAAAEEINKIDFEFLAGVRPYRSGD
jgi:integrase